MSEEVEERETLALIVYMCILYIIVPLLLLPYAIQAHGKPSMLRSLMSGIAFILTLCVAVSTRKELNEQPPFLLAISTILLFSWMKFLRVWSGRFDPSVVEFPDKFLIFFLLPSNVSFGPQFVGVRWRGLRRILIGVGEALLSLIAWQVFGMLLDQFPVLITYQRLMYLPETIIVYLHIRILLNSALVGTSELIYGDGIHVEETWRNLAAASSLQEIWRGWNTGVHDTLLECVYLPLRQMVGSKVSFSSTFVRLIAMAATFLASGLLHEVTIWIRVGRWSGFQVAFFMLQFLGIILEGLLRRRHVSKLSRSTKSWSEHVGGRIFLYAWLALTLPAFMAEVGPTVEEFFERK